jgi:hypothetical protein
LFALRRLEGAGTQIDGSCTPTAPRRIVRKTLINGLAFAFAAALVVRFGGTLGLSQSPYVMLGLASGAALGLIPIGVPGMRIAAWAIGAGAGVLGYALWISVLPDSASGRAVATFFVVIGIAVIGALSYGALPLWAQLLGVADVIGVYHVELTSPSAFTADSARSVTTMALGAALGFLVTSVADQLAHPPGSRPGMRPAVIGGVPQPRQQTTPVGSGATSGPGGTGTSGAAGRPGGPGGVEIINQLKNGA